MASDNGKKRKPSGPFLKPKGRERAKVVKPSPKPREKIGKPSPDAPTLKARERKKVEKPKSDKAKPRPRIRGKAGLIKAAVKGAFKLLRPKGRGRKKKRRPKEP